MASVTGKRRRDESNLAADTRSGFSHPDHPLGVVDVEKADSFDVGPLSVLKKAVLQDKQVLINVRNNRKLLARVKAFDRHCNMVLQNVTEIWREYPKGKPDSAAVERSRAISKMFLRGDSVILVLLNPK